MLQLPEIERLMGGAEDLRHKPNQHYEKIAEIFNAIGLVLASFLLLGALGSVSLATDSRHLPDRGQVFWMVFCIYWLALTLMIGGGSLINLARRRLSFWPTIIVISGYYLSLWLIPFGIWGIVAMVRDRKKRRQRPAHTVEVSFTTSRSHSL